MEASRHTAVLCGVEEGWGAEDVMQQVASKSVALFTLEVKGQLQNLDQFRTIWQDFITIYPSYLGGQKALDVTWNLGVKIVEYTVSKWSKSPLTRAGGSTETPYQVPPHSTPLHLGKKNNNTSGKLVRLMRQITNHTFRNLVSQKLLSECAEHLLTAIWLMALQQCGTNTLSDSAGWHWKAKHGSR